MTVQQNLIEIIFNHLFLFNLKSLRLFNNSIQLYTTQTVLLYIGCSYRPPGQIIIRILKDLAAILIDLHWRLSGAKFCTKIEKFLKILFFMLKVSLFR